MAELIAADLKPLPSQYHSTRALNDVLIGSDETARPLFEACSTGDVAALRKILSEKPEVALEEPHRIYMIDQHATTQSGVPTVRAMKRSNVTTAIFRAADNGHAEAVSVLLDFAAQHGLPMSTVIIRDTIKTTIEKNYPAVYDVLATADAKTVVHTDLTHQRPLDLALKSARNLELIRVILKHGGGRPMRSPGDAEFSYAPRSGSRMCEAAKRSLTIVELLIENGYPVKGSGALQAAAEWGKLDVLRFLVEKGADVNDLLPAKTLPRRDQALYASWTPLHFAASRDREEAMQLLESLGARADVVDVEGRTPSQLMQEVKDSKRAAGF